MAIARTMLQRAALAFTAAFVLPIAGVPAGDFEPDYAKAGLYGPDNRVYPRVSVTRNWREFHETSGLKIVIEGDTVLISSTDRQEPHRVRSPDGRHLRWLDASSGIVFFVAENTKADLERERHFLYAEIRRLDLDTLSWLPSWVIDAGCGLPQQAADSRRVEVLGTLVTKDDAVAVLTYTMTEEPQWSAEITAEDAEKMDAEYREWLKRAVYSEPSGYRVSRYEARADKPAWSKWFSVKCEDDLPAMRAAGVWGRNESDLQLLTWIETWSRDAILVCAGEKEDLICVAAADGEERWRTTGLWEYERGYIGPSVFEYFVERFGLDTTTVWLAEGESSSQDPQDGDRAKRILDKARSRFKRTYKGWTLAGPVLVPNEREDHIFVAAARRRKNNDGPGHEEPPQCTVYELESEEGDIVAATTLPRMVEGRLFKVLPDALIWLCERGSVVRLLHYENDFRRGFFGPGRASNDAICRVAWYREYPMQVPDCSFWVDPPTGVAAFGRDHLFRPDAAYVLTEDEKIYRFGINVVDLKTGLDYGLKLAIPFRGDFEQTDASGPYLLAVNALAVEGNILRVVMERCEENVEKVALEFDLGAE